MAIPAGLQSLRLPAIGSPMFIVSSPELVVAQCRQGVLGTMPSLNVREPEQLDAVLAGIADALEAHNGQSAWPIAPFGVNLIAHHSNARLEHDLEVCVRRRVPVIITSLGPSARIAEQVHDYGGLLFHDVINVRHARKAIAAGVDGIVAVAAGAGGHAGVTSPFALCAEIRDIFDGCLVLAGAISRGGDIVAAQAMGADLAYVGTRLIATAEANAPEGYKRMILASGSSDVVYTPFFSGVSGNYLRPSISAAGLDPDDLEARRKDTMSFGADGSKAKAWKDVWGAGHGVGAINDLPSVADLVQRLAVEYDDAVRRLSRPE
jgi:nitronate monooxygenase